MIWRAGLAALNSSSAFVIPPARCSDQFWPGALTPTTICTGPSFGSDAIWAFPSAIARSKEVLSNERLARLLRWALGSIDVDANDSHPVLAGFLQDRGEGVVVDDRRQQSIGLACKRGLHVGGLLLNRTFRLREDHLAIRLYPATRIVKALLDGLPERVGRRGMDRESDLQGCGFRGAGDHQTDCKHACGCS